MTTNDLTVEDFRCLLKLLNHSEQLDMTDEILIRAVVQLQRLQSRRCETCQHQGPKWLRFEPVDGSEVDSTERECQLPGSFVGGRYNRVPLTVNGQPFSCAAWTEKEAK